MEESSLTIFGGDNDAENADRERACAGEIDVLPEDPERSDDKSFIVLRSTKDEEDDADGTNEYNKAIEVMTNKCGDNALINSCREEINTLGKDKDLQETARSHNNNEGIITFARLVGIEDLNNSGYFDIRDGPSLKYVGTWSNTVHTSTCSSTITIIR